MQYFSKQWCFATFETIYNLQNATNEEWDFECGNCRFTCSLSKDIGTGKETSRIVLRSDVLVGDDGKSVVRIQFRSTASYSHNGNRYDSQVTSTKLEFSTVDSLHYKRDRFHLGGFIFSVHWPTQTQDEAFATFLKYLKFLDDGIAEFQHPILLNVKALIDAHNAALAVC